MPPRRRARARCHRAVGGGAGSSADRKLNTRSTGSGPPEGRENVQVVICCFTQWSTSASTGVVATTSVAVALPVGSMVQRRVRRSASTSSARTFLLRATSIRHSARGSNRVAISRASSLSSITPGGGGASATVAAGATGASWLCRRTAGAIVVPSCAIGMSAIRPARLGSSPFKPEVCACASADEYADTERIVATQSPIVVPVLLMASPSAFPTFPRFHIQPAHERDPRTTITYVQPRRDLASTSGGAAMGGLDRMFCGCAAFVLSGVLTPLAVAEPAKPQTAPAPAARQAQARAVVPLGLLHHVAQREIALGLLAQVAASRPETLRFASD